jgi:hypothetical protein
VKTTQLQVIQGHLIAYLDVVGADEVLNDLEVLIVYQCQDYVVPMLR